MLSLSPLSFSLPPPFLLFSSPSSSTSPSLFFPSPSLLPPLLFSSLLPLSRLSSTDVYLILGNLEDINTFQQMLVQSLEECTKLPESQQRVGGFFMNLMPQMKALYVGYCSNHPSAVNVLTQHSEELGEFMEGKGASSPGILTLTTGLSKPFMRLDKYPTLTKELERHMEESHPDWPDIQKCMTTFKSLSVSHTHTHITPCFHGYLISSACYDVCVHESTCYGTLEYMSMHHLHTQDHLVIISTAWPKVCGHCSLDISF
ncbi:unnamed protein product [Oncorhynchus mykiss]|uniref:DH domain-containing protein n=1 Tax=Oncorhynchus mykiss TaxID=8022 RepID=A0A060Y3W0_ONCMY|nr:unnamed protein product [Oncorhynchus mykiss]